MFPRIGKVVGAFFRGAIKAFPLGNAIIEGVNNAKGGVTREVVTETGDIIKGHDPNPHDWVSVITQIAIISIIIWGLASGNIDISQAMVWLMGN